MNAITIEQFEVLNKAMKIIKRDNRRPNGDSWSDAIAELQHYHKITNLEFEFLDHFRSMVDISELPSNSFGRGRTQF